MLKAVLFLTVSAFAAAGPILVFGSGSFLFDPMDAVFQSTVSFSGSDGINSVDVAQAMCNNIAGTGCLPQFGGAAINGLNFSAGFFSFSLGGGGGSVTGYNAQHQAIVMQSLVSFVEETSRTCNPRDGSCEGTLSISAVPEPTSFALLAASLVFLTLRRASPRS